MRIDCGLVVLLLVCVAQAHEGADRSAGAEPMQAAADSGGEGWLRFVLLLPIRLAVQVVRVVAVILWAVLWRLAYVYAYARVLVETLPPIANQLDRMIAQPDTEDFDPLKLVSVLASYVLLTPYAACVTLLGPELTPAQRTGVLATFVCGCCWPQSLYWCLLRVCEVYYAHQMARFIWRRLKR